MFTTVALGKRISETLELVARDQAWLARDSSTDPRTLSAVITRDSERSVYAPKWAASLGLELHWALTGEGPQFAVNPGEKFGKSAALISVMKQQHGRYNTGHGPKMREDVPLISWVQAGTWTDVSDPYAVGDAERWLPCAAQHGPRTYALRVRGESMYNPGGKYSFQDGEVIFVDPDRPPENGSLVVVRLDSAMEATFKQLIKEGDRVYLKALNPAWPESIMRVNGDATICGVVFAKFVLF